MKNIEVISEGDAYSAVDLGSLNGWLDYSLVHPISKREIEGKVFLKEATKSTGTEISFNSIAPRSEVPYFHIHRKNEETYIILKGCGYFQVDEDCFSIKEGSVIRVSPQGKRGLTNTSDEIMTYIVIQSKENSLEEHTTADGERIPVEPKWR
ncbi:cupin domain-containing protein [Alistipes sp. ZOR0009]|jgi:mannose-6-phosphate isomerase-like protein (cupin superfamily)|uniref:cupin domain-containing protein n=1 Tax=Alistipes sp. ZOR0009 TaxID=1339253 RepID=UPI0006464F57|nr:cupin domain-containing protein [Alistipes sp. ZOR0009]